MNKLIQLSDGSWIDPSKVTCIRACDATTISDTKTVPPRVDVNIDGKHAWFPVDSFEDACRERDRIAEAANQ